MSKLEFYLNRIIKYGLYAILLTPLVFWPRALYGFMTPKFILFQVLVEIVFAAWLILKFQCWKPSFQHKLSFNNLLAMALASFIIASFISAIFGVDFSRSFWGIGARMTGLFAELHFFAWFLVLINFFRPKFDFSRSPTPQSRGGLQILKADFSSYINFSFAVSVLLAITGFFTISQWRLVPGYTFFSNPTFVAPYFLFHFFWGLYQITNYKLQITNYKGWIFGAGSALILISLFLGQIRGAVIGLVAGVLFLGIGLVFSDIFSRRKRIILAASYLLLLIGAIFFWQWRDAPLIQNIGILKKFSQTSLSSATAQTRLLTWQAAFKGFKDRPIFGAGPENFNYVFNKHYNPRLLMFGGGGFAETWQDKPHNAFLEILTETGIIGAAAYSIVWLVAAFVLFKLFIKGQKLLSLILGGAFISYFGTVFFSFDSFGSWFGLFLFLAFLASHSDSNLQIHSNSTNKFVEFGYIRRLGLLIVLIATLFLIYQNYSIWRANIADADALRVFSKDTGQGIELFKKSLSYNTPYGAEYQFDLIASVFGALAKNLPIPQLEDNLNFALDEADKAIRAHPQNAAYYTDMAKLYNILGEKGRNPEILNQAEIFGKKSLELSPNRQETRFYLARTALLKGDSELAVEWSKQAADLDLAVNLSHWYFGLALIADNQKETGKIEIKKALELGFKPQNSAEEAFIKNIGL